MSLKQMRFQVMSKLITLDRAILTNGYLWLEPYSQMAITNINRKSHVLYRMVTFPMTLMDH